VLGDRVAAVSQYFSRYRFNRLTFEFRSKLPTSSTGTYVVGVLDDDNASTSTTPAQVLDYRTSRERHVFQDILLNWSPIDRQKWYYTTPSQDGRMNVPCTVFVTTEDYVPNASLFSFDLHYSITLEGATTNVVAVSEPKDEVIVSLPPTPSGAPAPPLSKIHQRR